MLLTTDEAIRKLNRQFRGKNKATDVLSFPAEAAGPEKIAGDLAISVPTARRQGTACGHSLETEIKVLILHGLLHLAGYDHETDNGRMARRERRLRAQLKLPQGLIERTGKPTLPGKPARPKLRPGTGVPGNQSASRREAMKIAQGGVRERGRNPGKTRPPSRRPGGPARNSASPSARQRS